MSKQQSLQKLQQHWYRKLEKEGFKDIEDSQGRLKVWTGHVLHDEFANPLPEHDRRESSKISKTSQAEYYRLASQYLFDKKFPSKDYKKIWQHHAAGLTNNQVGRRLSMSKWQVRYRIRKLKRKFGL